MLGPRQRAAYANCCNIWKPSYPIDPTSGIPADVSWSLAYSNVPCLYEYTPNVSDASEGFGSIKRAGIFTDDTIHMDAAQACDQGWIIVNVSLISGAKSPVYGETHIALGAPNIIPSAGSRHANKRSVMAQVLEHPPTSIVIPS